MVLLGIPLAVSAGIYFAMKYTEKKSDRLTPLVALHGGQQVLKRLIGYHGALAKMDLAEATMKRILIEDKSVLNQDKRKRPNIKKLERAIAELEMTSRAVKAADMLKCAFEDAEAKGNLHEAYEFQMLYVEMLIYMGQWDAALTCKCLEDQRITDARRPLFKAVINILSEKVSEGKKYWEEFREIRENMRLPETSEEDGPYILANNFDEFKKIVELLRQDIKNAKPV